ncbi:MAG: PilZ domain-containing protein [Clostridia bacterium]|nr:PilZ domain-containing protein [Clostridia bacterium]
MATSILSEFFPGEDINNFFKKGTVVTVHHLKILDVQLPSVVQRADSANLYVVFTEAFLKNNVLKGDNVVCKIRDEKYEYLLSGVVSDIELSFPGLAKVAVTDIKKFNNARKSKRYGCNMPSHVYTSDSTVYSIVKNMSATGVFAIFKEYVSKGTAVKLKVWESIGKDDFIEFKAEVIRIVPKYGYYEYGFRILEIDEKNSATYDRLLSQLQHQEELYLSGLFKKQK